MGIDPSTVNATNVAIVRPDRSGPGGDEVGSGAAVGSGLQALVVDEDRLFRRARGREAVSFAQFFMDPWADDDGEIAEVLVGDLVSWTNAFGRSIEPQEIISVEPTRDCEGLLDVVTFRVGRTSAVEV